jgi:hypothetical protein
MVCLQEITTTTMACLQEECSFIDGKNNNEPNLEREEDEKAQKR